MTSTSISAKQFREKYAVHIKDRQFVYSLVLSLVFLVGAMTLNFLAGTYAAERASNSVSDIILSNIPVFNVDNIFVYGPIIFWVIVSIYCLRHPHKLPFWLKSVALFVLVRSIFITLTHIGPFPDHIPINSFTLSSNVNFYIFSSGSDLFFSGHTGLPFLLALLFWENKPMRYFCLLSSIFFGMVVLLGHLHYTIDVMSAFFISYAIYHIALKLFPRDRNRFIGIKNQ